MTKLAGLMTALMLGLAAPAKAQTCPGCIQNSAAPQNAQMNIGTATVRGTLTAGTLNATSMTTTSLTVSSITGNGSAITALNASQLTSGIVAAARLVGSYTGITELGTIVSGIWNGAVVGTQYGGTGNNWVTKTIGHIPYFSTTGTMNTLAPGAAGTILQSNGAAAPSWTAAPQVAGTNVTAIPLANLQNGTLPSGIAVGDASLTSISAAKVSGNIAGGAASLTVPLPVGNLAAGTLPTSNAASSITVTGVAPGTYGGPTQMPQIHVRSDGRIDSVGQSVLAVPTLNISTGALPANVTIAAAYITTGTLPSYVMASSVTNSGVAAGSYGDATRTVTAVVMSDGRMTSMGQQLIAINPSQINSGALPGGITVPAASISAGTLASDVTATKVANSGVSAGTYGGLTQIPQLTVGADGRVTSATQFTFPALSTSTVASNLDNDWSHAQTSFSSWTFHADIAAQNVNAVNLLGNGDGITSLNPGVINAGSLPSTVIASSIALNSVLDGSIVSVSGSKLIGTIPVASGGTGATTSTGALSNLGAVAKVGDTMTGQLTISGSSLTVKGNAFSVGTSTFVVRAGNVGIGTGNPGTTLDLVGSSTQQVIARIISGTPAGGLNSGFVARTNSDTSNSVFIAERTRGTTASPTAIAGGDIMGWIAGKAHDGTTIPLDPSVLIAMTAAEAHTPSAKGTNIRFETTPIGSVSRAQVAIITSTGNVGIGTQVPSERLHVVGNALVSSSVTASYLLGDGSGVTNVTAASVPQSGVNLSTVTTALAGKLSNTATVPTGLVNLSTVTTALAGKLSNTSTVPTGLIDLSTVTSALAGKLSNTSTVPTGLIDLSTVTSALAGKLSNTTTVPPGLIDLSTVTSALAGKLSNTTTVPPGLVDLSTVTSALAGKASNGANSDITSLSALSSASATGQISAGGFFTVGSSTAGFFYGNGSNLTGITSSGETNTFTSSKTFTSDVLVFGSVTASGFFGDGSGLTNVPSTGETNTFTSSKTFTNQVLVQQLLTANGSVKTSTLTVASNPADSVLASFTNTTSHSKVRIASNASANPTLQFSLDSGAGPTDYGFLRLSGSGTGTPLELFSGGAGIGLRTDSIGYMASATGTGSTFLANVSGRIGIGSGLTSPGAKLEVVEASALDPYSFHAGTSLSAYDLVVATTGRVGVATQTPAYPLHVTGDSFASGQGIIGGTMTVLGNGLSVGGAANAFSVSPLGIYIGTNSYTGSSLINASTSNAAGAIALISNDGGAVNLNLRTYGSGSAVLQGRKARGSVASPTAVQTFDTLLTLNARGYNGTAFSNDVARITIQPIETFTTTSNATQIVMSPTAFNAVTPTSVFTVRTNTTTVETGAFQVRDRLIINGADIADLPTTTRLDVDGLSQFGTGAIKSTFTATGALNMASGANITGNLIGNVTGSAANNVLLTGDTMTGQLTLAGSTLTVGGASFSVAGNVGGPSLMFNSGTGTGLWIGTNTYSPSVLINASTSTTAAASVVFGNDGGGSQLIVQRVFSNTASSANQLSWRRSLGTSTTPLALASGNLIGKLDVRGHDGVQFSTNEIAGIQASAVDAFTTTNQPTQWAFRTTAKNSINDSPVMTVRSDTVTINVPVTAITGGGLGLGTTTPATKLDVIGDAQFGSDGTRSTFTTTGALNMASGANITGNLVGNVTGSASNNVLLTGDTMTGQLTTASTITVQGSAFSVGGTALSVSNVTGVYIGTNSYTASGLLNISTTSATNAPAVVSINNDGGGSTSLNMRTYSTNANSVPQLVGRKAGGTSSVPLAMAANTLIMKIDARPFDGTQFSANEVAAMQFTTIEPASSTGTGTGITFRTTAKGATSDVGMFTIRQDTTTVTTGVFSVLGNLGIATQSPGAKLDVAGNAQFGSGVSKSTFTSTGDLYIAVGASLGVGTSSPSSIFQVGGGTLSATSDGFVTTGGGTITTDSLSSCGVLPSVATGSNNNSGKITIGTGGSTACVLTFTATWPNSRAPACVVTNETTANLLRATSTASQVTLAGVAVSGDVLAYICLGM